MGGFALRQLELHQEAELQAAADEEPLVTSPSAPRLRDDETTALFRLGEIFGGPLTIAQIDGTMTETLLNVKVRRKNELAALYNAFRWTLQVPVTGTNSSGMAFVQAMRPDASKAWKYTYSAVQKPGGSKRIPFDPED